MGRKTLISSSPKFNTQTTSYRPSIHETAYRTRPSLLLHMHHSSSTRTPSNSRGFSFISDYMWGALRSRSRSLRLSSPSSPWKQGLLGLNLSTASSATTRGLLDLQEIEKVLSDVRADNVKVIPVPKHSDWADFMVVATGRSTWHVKNIAQALIYKAKQKQKGEERLVLPSVEGEEGGKWIVIDSGKVIVHALDEKAREYYNLEGLWTTETSQKESNQELEKAFVKIRPKNNSKKRVQKTA